MSNEKAFDFKDALEEMSGGTFNAALSRALQDTALATAEHGRKGKKGRLVITLDLERLGESNQVTMTHRLSASRPTLRGKATEEYATETVFYVSSKGHLSVTLPHPDMFKQMQENGETA